MDWLTGLVTIAAMERIRRRYWDGWLIGLVGQLLWAWLIWQRRLWGLAPLCLILTIQYALALRTWRRERDWLARLHAQQQAEIAPGPTLSQRREWRA